jgi:hypothetical protein
MSSFDFTATAELFPARSWKARARRITYKRFDKAAEAVRYAIEELPPQHLLGTYLEVEEERFDSGGIRRLQGQPDHPLRRSSAHRAAGSPRVTTRIAASLGAQIKARRPARWSSSSPWTMSQIDGARYLVPRGGCF